ncbi:hypothetical protein GJ496_002577 [Pomphorhynchus laevis]|nr:hypothetical protein GJ496_002577 [Pomphorhynchus laevis]
MFSFLCYNDARQCIITENNKIASIDNQETVLNLEFKLLDTEKHKDVEMYNKEFRKELENSINEIRECLDEYGKVTMTTLLMFLVTTSFNFIDEKYRFSPLEGTDRFIHVGYFRIRNISSKVENVLDANVNTINRESITCRIVDEDNFLIPNVLRTNCKQIARSHVIVSYTQGDCDLPKNGIKIIQSNVSSFQPFK